MIKLNSSTSVVIELTEFSIGFYFDTDNPNSIGVNVHDDKIDYYDHISVEDLEILIHHLQEMQRVRQLHLP